MLRLDKPTLPLDRVDVATARVTRVRELRPPGHPSTGQMVEAVLIDPGATTYAYSNRETTSDLFVVTGLR